MSNTKVLVLIVALGCVLSFGFTGIAVADTLSVDTSFSYAGWLAPSQSVSGIFDITPQVQAYGNYEIPYTILNANAIFNFVGSSIFQYFGTTYGSYSYFSSCTVPGGPTCYAYGRHINDIHVDALDSASVTVGGQTTSGHDGANYSSSTISGWEWVYEYQLGPYCWLWTVDSCWYENLYHKNDTTYEGYSGAFSVGETLTGGALASLSSGSIGWTLTNTGGSSLYFDSGSLHVDLEAAPVPEPSTMLLLGSGLAGLALWRRGAQRGREA